MFGTLQFYPMNVLPIICFRTYVYVGYVLWVARIIIIQHIYVWYRVLRSAESNLLTVPPRKPGKYGSRSFVRASANLWNSLRGERAAWLKIVRL